MMPTVSPWLQFTLIAAGVLLAIFAAAALVRGRLGRRSIPAGVAAIVPAAFLIVMPLQLGRATDRANTQRRANAGTPENQARDRCLFDGNAESLVRFVGYIRKAIPADATYTATSPGQSDNACLTYVLLPREHVDPDKAQWILFIGPPPAGATRTLVPGTFRQFAPGQAIGRLRA